MPHSDVNRWHNRSRFPGRAKLGRVAQHFGVTVGWLMAHEDPPPPVRHEEPHWKAPERAVVIAFGERLAEARGHLDEIAAWLGRYVDDDERKRWEALRSQVRDERRKGRRRPGAGGSA